MENEKLISITLNNKSLSVKKNSTILEVCKEIGLNIPTLCHDERLKPYSACRICVVEVNGSETLLPS